MAITNKDRGAGVSTETSGAALSPLCPATVDAGDILLAHVYFEGIVTAPSTPSGWDLITGPHVIETNVARHWVFGRIADGSEDGAAVAFGNPAVTTMRAARIYSLGGRIAGTIQELTGDFSHTSHPLAPTMPTVTTPKTGAMAIAMVGMNDNNGFSNPTGETGGDWVFSTSAYTVALTPGFSIGMCIAIPTSDPGTISGGGFNASNQDPCGVIGLYVSDDVLAAGQPAAKRSGGVPRMNPRVVGARGVRVW